MKTQATGIQEVENKSFAGLKRAFSDNQLDSALAFFDQKGKALDWVFLPKVNVNDGKKMLEMV